MLHVLHFSSHDEDCGIAKYQGNYLASMTDSAEVANRFFSYSPYQTRDMDRAELGKVLEALTNEAKDFDILHIQHEFGFFRDNQFERLVSAAKDMGMKVVVTYHTSPDLIIIKKPLAGMGPRALLSFLRSYRYNRILSNMHTRPLLSADRILVHNLYTKNSLIDFKIPAEKIELIPHPTYEISKPKKTTFVADSLDKKSGDIILSCVGYIHRFKGVDKSIKALKFLPDNYKLAVLGGVKSDSDDQELYDQISDLIIKLGLKDRVFISGVIPSDDDLNSYIQETDVCLYPYNSSYYKGIGSGSINLAIANDKPIVAYPVSTFIETNKEFGHIAFTDSDSYYELAREIRRLDITAQTKKTVSYRSANAWGVMAKRLVAVYTSL